MKTKEEISEETAVKIIDNLRSRGLFDDLFGNFDEEINDEILLEMSETIEAGYTACQYENRWVPVSEKLPENSSTVLAIDEYGGMYTCYYLPHCETWFTEKTSAVKEIVSWQPLPNPPKK